jgi:hypothetical protein
MKWNLGEISVELERSVNIQVQSYKPTIRFDLFSRKIAKPKSQYKIVKLEENLGKAAVFMSGLEWKISRN